jgi:hypothetical protein
MGLGSSLFGTGEVTKGQLPLREFVQRTYWKTAFTGFGIAGELWD